MAKTFDYAAFKAAFRASAKAHGIDPVAGATSYQAANLKADLRKAEMIAAPDYGWATANGRDIFSESESAPTQIVVARTPASDLQQHEQAWTVATTGEKPRARAVWTMGAGLPERQLIPS